jgi:probable F420-dependent oxidoreductase
VVRVVPEGRVAFGIQLPIQAQSHLFAEPWEAAAGPAEVIDVARVAEHAGFEYLAACDHAAIPKDKAVTMSTTWWDTIATLSYVAALTSRIRLLSHVYVLPYTHPLRAAKQWSTLDTLSGGRAILGVGAGHVEGEFDALGVDFARRGALLDEAIDAVRAALADEYSSHEGTYWSYREMGVAPQPARGRVPIWVGGSSAAAIRRAATRGDGWLPQGAPEGGMSAAIAHIRQLREEAGRSGEPFTIGALSGPLYVGEPTWDIGRAVTGSPEQVAGFLRVLAGLGVNQIQVAFRSRDAHELYDQVRRFGAEVAPLVQPG